MGLIERFRELDTAVQVIIGLAIVAILIPVVIAGVVILAAVIGTFVLGVGTGGATTDVPQASFGFETSDGTVTVTHTGGDTIEAERLVIRVADRQITWAARSDTSAVSAGNSVTLEAESGVTVRVIYEGVDGPEVLARYTVP